jgi:hypothetical protein
MGFPASPAFNPTVTKVPTLGPSSGDPVAKKDPKSVASVGANIQAMQDQANAERLYDAPVTQVSEGFGDYSVPWIVKSQACRRVQGFSDMGAGTQTKYAPLLAGLGVILIAVSFICKE